MAERVQLGPQSTAFQPSSALTAATKPNSSTVSASMESEPEADPEPPLIAASETYVVQVPKDQIYRVPPPENAYLVEHYRNAHKNRKHKSSCFSCLAWVLSVVTILAILLVIGLVIFFVLIRLGTPKFTVNHVTVKNPSTKPSYVFSMRVNNPSARVGIFYNRGGKASLTYKGVKIADGETPGFYQGTRNSTSFALILRGSHIIPPKDIQKVLKGSKEAVNLNLSMEFGGKVKVGVIEKGGMSTGVTCDIKVSGLVTGGHIASQECKTNFQP
ncbi:NDR1/HIN1-like protein 13 [Typha angustifolia]|uniref:NDR1/HIN1-like protein 13 n=1 Tax=Typha angustifolia TaxID=59011 RepID=UPI003C2E056F